MGMAVRSTTLRFPGDLRKKGLESPISLDSDRARDYASPFIPRIRKVISHFGSTRLVKESPVFKGGPLRRTTAKMKRWITFWAVAATCLSIGVAFGASNPISSVTLSPTSVTGGSSSTGTVTLKSAAPTGGAVVSLKSSNTAVATVGASVTVAAGKTSATFLVSSIAVSANSSASITATYSTGSSSATLTVTAPAVSSVAVAPSAVQGGSPSTGTVTLTGAAPSAGMSVTLTSSNTSAATVPSSVTVPSGALTANFAVATLAVSSSTSVTITAKIGTASKTTTLTVNPAPPAVSSVSLNSPSVLGGLVSGVTVNLITVAPAGGVTVNLSSSNTAVATVPPSVSIPAGSSSTSFGATSLNVSADTNVTITATTSTGSPQSAVLTVVANLTVTVDNGNGPFYTNQNSVGFNGHLHPGSAGPSASVTGTLGSQNLSSGAMDSSGVFDLSPFTLSAGTNVVNVNAVEHTTGKQASLVQVTYVLDTTPPTATVALATQIPDPTNQPTWTLQGTINGYQGTVENANVVVGSGLCKVPIASNGTWSGPCTFPEGFHTYPLAVSDQAGNVGASASHITADVDTQGGRILFHNNGPSPNPTASWPATLDLLLAEDVSFYGEAGQSLRGSHLDIFFDEPGGGPNDINCTGGNLGCLLQRNTTPDVSYDFPASSLEVDLPPLRVGNHNIRMLLRDVFGKTTERGGVLIVSPQSQYTFSGASVPTYGQPEPNVAVPGPVTTRFPKLAGLAGVGVSGPIDCHDLNWAHIPHLQYWNPSSNAWVTLPLTILAGVAPYDVWQQSPTASQLPHSGIPLTTNTSGQTVIRLRSSEDGSGVPTHAQLGGDRCDTFGTFTDMEQTTFYSGGDSDGWIYYDILYRPPNSGDSANPQIDTSTIPASATSDAPTSVLAISFRVTDLNADLNYHSVTIKPSGCTTGACQVIATLDSDQRIGQTNQGGWFRAKVTVNSGSNSFSVSATDDAGHTGSANFSVTISLTAVQAVVTAPVGNGETYSFCLPQTITFDASQSVNRTSPQVPLRYQWTSVNNGSYALLSNSATYSETITQNPLAHRVIVSSTAVGAPNPSSATPCSPLPAGQCDIATISLQAYGAAVTLSPQILSPASGASVRNDQPVTLYGTAAQQLDPSYVYWWSLKRNSDGHVFAIPQATGTGSDPAYSAANQQVVVTLDSIAGLTAGPYTLTLNAAYQTLTGNCTVQKASASITVNIITKSYVATGLSPGFVVTGATGIRLYGSGFDSAANIVVEGPTYALGDVNFMSPLCSAPSCPTQFVTPIAAPDGSQLTFNLTEGLAPGYYDVYAWDPVSTAMSDTSRIEVQPTTTAGPTKTQTFSNVATAIANGQTITNQFLTGRDPSGQFSDVDFYSFYATAGSKITVSLARTDTSTSWFDPNTIDPELYVVAPDGVVYNGLDALDNVPGVDLNASITNGVLPQTGLYFIDAATTKGAGGYALSFSLTPAAPSASDQIAPANDNDRTAPINTPGLTPFVMVFDKNGDPLSWAVTQFSAAPQAGETGMIAFPSGATILANTRGLAGVPAQLTATGKISFTANLQASGLIQPQAAPPTLQHLAQRTIVAHQVPRPDGFVPGSWDIRLAPGRLTAVPTEKIHPPIRSRASAAPATGTAPRKGSISALPTLAFETAGSSATNFSKPSAIIRPEDVVIATGCGVGQPKMRAAGVAATTVQGPYTITLEDETPPLGGTTENGLVDLVAGIHDHRVDHTIRLKLDILDANGNEIPYPVLVHVRPVGIRPGSITLNATGTPVTCTDASFVWHDRDANGNLIANDEFDYKLGTDALFLGLDGNGNPIWGTPEFLEIFFGGPGSALTDYFEEDYPVHPVSGAPDHLQWNPTSQGPPNQMTINSGFGFCISCGNPNQGSDGLTNVYYVVDSFGNNVYQQVTTQAQNPGGQFNIQTTFSWQGSSPGSDQDPEAFTLGFTWQRYSTDGSTGANTWPNETDNIQLTVTGTDPETGSFSLQQNVTAIFTTSLFYAIVGTDNYDPPYDNYFDISTLPATNLALVSPGSARLLRDQTTPLRTSVLLVTGTQFGFFWGQAGSPGQPVPEGQVGDPMLLLGSSEKFDVSLVDSKGHVATDAVFSSTTCPIYDHTVAINNTATFDTRPCPPALPSVNGLIIGVTPDRGYIGLTMSTAPHTPGDYFFLVTREASDLYPWTTAGQGNGGVFACTVTGTAILDQDFNLFTHGLIRVTQPTPAFIRSIIPNGPSSITTTVTSLGQTGGTLTNAAAVTLGQVGTSSTYLGAITVVPEDYPSGASPEAWASPQAAATPPIPNIIAGLGLGRFQIPLSQGSSSPSIDIPSAFPGVLVVNFLTRSGSALTPPDATHPQPGQAQQTEIGDTSDNYAERVWLQIQAVNPYSPSEIQLTDDSVGIIEALHSEYTADTQLFYDGKSGSTSIDASGRLGALGSEAFVQLTNGQAKILLKSVADARILATGQQDPVPYAAIPYAGSAGAILQAVPASPTDPSQPEPSVTPTYVNLWVDEREYDRRPVSSSSTWSSPDSQDGIRDWLEKKVWDFYCDHSSSNPEEITSFSRVGTLTETMSTSVPGTVSTSPPTTTGSGANERWTLYATAVRHPYTEPLFYDESGLAVTAPPDSFPNLCVHEARHAWQYTLGTIDGLTDGDGDYYYETTPASAPTLLDARYSLDVNAPGNPEFDLLGDTCQDIGATTVDSNGHQTAFVLKAPREVDAIREAAPDTATAESCAIAPDPNTSGYSLTVTQPSPTAVAAQVVFSARPFGNGTGQTIALPYEGATVVFEVTSGSWTLTEVPYPNACPTTRADVRKAVGRATIRNDGTALAGVTANPPGDGTTSTLTITLVQPPECAGAAPIVKTVTLGP